MKLKTLIVDDDPIALKMLQTLCNQNEHLDLGDQAVDGKDAISKMKEVVYDLVILDIQMPELSGLDLMEHLPYFPHIIFVTSNTDYAYEAYEYEIIDFVKKPLIPARFNKAIAKAIEVEEQLNKTSQFSAGREIYVKHDGRFVRLPYDSIYYFENVGDYISIKSEIGNFIIHGALKTIDQKLTYPGFLKIHRSYIINLQKVKDIEDNTLVINKKVIPISRSHKAQLMRSINILT